MKSKQTNFKYSDELSALSREFMKLPEIINNMLSTGTEGLTNGNKNIPDFSLPISEGKKVTDNIVNMMNILKSGTDSFTGKLLTGFSETLGIVNSIASILKSISQASSGLGVIGELFSGLLGFIPGIGPALSAVSHASGSNISFLNTGGDMMMNNLNSFSAGSSNPIINHIHITGTMDGQTFLMKNYTIHISNHILKQLEMN